MTRRARRAARETGLVSGERLPERIWVESTPISIGPGMFVSGPVSYHHEWWWPVGKNKYEQRHEEITAEHFAVILARMRRER